MNDDDYKMLGMGLLGFFFGVYDKKIMQDAKEWLGKWIIERGGVDKVLNDYYIDIPKDQKESLINLLKECEKIAIKKGLIKSNNHVDSKN